MNCGIIADPYWQQAALPIRIGGSGMTTVGEMSQFVFISSWPHTLSALTLHFPNIAPSIDDLFSCEWPEGRVGYEIYQATPPGNSLIDLVHDPKRPQSKSTSQYTRSVANYMTEHAGSPREAARLRSLQKGCWSVGHGSSRIRKKITFQLADFVWHVCWGSVCQCLLWSGLRSVNVGHY